MKKHLEIPALYKLFVLFMLALVFFLSGCQTDHREDGLSVQASKMEIIGTLPVPTIKASMTTMAATPTVSPTVQPPALQPTAQTVCERPNIHVSTPLISDYFWSADGSTLFYATGEYKVMWWQFNISTVEKAFIASPKPPVESFLAAFGIPEIEAVAEFSVSPSESSIVFTRKIAPEKTPTVTPTPVAEGLRLNKGFLGKQSIFFMQKGSAKPVPIGQIDGWVDKFYWVPDERSILLLQQKGPGPYAMDYSMSKIDLQKGGLISQVIPRLVPPKSDYFRFLGIAKDRPLLLYYFRDEKFFYTLDLETGKETTILLPKTLPEVVWGEIAWGNVAWGDDHKTLRYVEPVKKVNEFIYEYAVKSYSIENGKSSEIGCRTILLGSNYGMLSITYSPTKNYAAYREALTGNLLLVQLKPESPE